MSAETPRPGPEFSRRFRLIEKLASDGSGEVYRAEPVAGGDPVRARLVSARLEARDAALLVGDAERYRAVAHANLLPLLEAGGANELPFLVYPQADAVSLDRLLEKHGRLAPAAALRIARGVVSGLAALHAKGLVHGFVHAAAVLMDRSGTAKLADGGMARLRGAPTAADDLRAVGDLVFQMLAGKLPARGSPPRLDRVLDGVPSALIELVERASVSAARGGFAKADDLGERLDALVSDPILGVRKEPFADLDAGGPEPASTVRQGAVPAQAQELEPTTEPDLIRSGLTEVALGSPAAPPDIDATPLPAPPPLRAPLVIPSARSVEARSAAKAPAAIKLELAPRPGPTFGQLVLILFAGFGTIGGIIWLNSQEKTFGTGSVAKGFGDDQPGRGPTRSPLKVPDDLDDLANAIVSENDVLRRAELTQKLLKKHEVKAPQVLSKILASGNDKLRRDLFPVLESMDKDGLLRAGLLREVTHLGTPWVVMLVSSLAASGKTAALGEIGTKQGAGALIALAGSTRDQKDLALDASQRFEEAFNKEAGDEARKLVEDWMRASGSGSLSLWVASTLLARVHSPEDRQSILEAMTAIPPSPAVFTAVQGTAEKLGFGWDINDHAYLETALNALAGSDPEKLAEIPKIMGKVAPR